MLVAKLRRSLSAVDCKNASLDVNFFASHGGFTHSRQLGAQYYDAGLSVFWLTHTSTVFPAGTGIANVLEIVFFMKGRIL
jgi:hypothetical protein